MVPEMKTYVKESQEKVNILERASRKRQGEKEENLTIINKGGMMEDRGEKKSKSVTRAPASKQADCIN
jgi:hypothetical protein